MKHRREPDHSRSTRQAQASTPRVLDPSGAAPSAARGGTERKAKRASGQGQRRPRQAQGERRAPRHAGNGTRSTRPSREARSRSEQNPRSRNTPVRKKRGIVFTVGIIVAALVVLVGGFIAIYYSSLFTITQVKVIGNVKLQASYITELAEVPEDSTFLRTNTDDITARLLSEPWIQSVSIEKGFPSTLTLVIVERPIAAVVDIVPESANDVAERWVISNDGVWIAPVKTEAPEIAEITPAETPEAPAEGTEGENAAGSEEGSGGESAAGSAGSSGGESAENTTKPKLVGAEVVPEELVNIPKIKDISAAVHPEAGKLETDDGITNAIALLNGFSSDMRSMVASISAPDAVKTNLTLYNNVGVGFGVAVDIAEKERAIATILQEHEGTVTFINVRVANKVTYRSTE